MTAVLTRTEEKERKGKGKGLKAAVKDVGHPQSPEWRNWSNQREQKMPQR